MKGALFLALVGAAHATPETQVIPFDGIGKLKKTEEHSMDVTLTQTGFITHIQGTATATAKEGAPWWNDIAVGFVYPPGACTLSYGGFTSTLRYPNYQGTLGLWKGSLHYNLPAAKESGPMALTNNFYVTAGTNISIGIRNGYGLSGTHSITLDASLSSFTLTIDPDNGGPSGNGEACTPGIYADGVAPSPPPDVAYPPPAAPPPPSPPPPPPPPLADQEAAIQKSLNNPDLTDKARADLEAELKDVRAQLKLLQESKDDSSGLSDGEIAGVAVGAAVGGIVLLAVVGLILRSMLFKEAKPVFTCLEKAPAKK